MDDGSFNPSNRYYESDLTRQKYYENKTYAQPTIAESKKDSKESRFGSISYGSSGNGNGYGTTGVGYGSMKIDIGGVALGALIGLGAILIIPKIAQVFAMGHGGYRRSLEDEMSTITNLLSKIDNSLEANNIDSTSCTQRMICNIVNDAMKNEKAGESTAFDEFVASFTKNPLFSYAIDGSAIKEAIKTGQLEDIDKCSSTYSKCPLNRENIVKVVSSLIPAE
ncbi:unnamed protein product [Ceutorhynchus assimilis]|uniref:Uncharacterized protein n=1 Tax=Ceutorhynchus assimilis TaxID=467358 RepID=A0A9N9MMD5_9CUCU|nr:unnamed protein product [Ceutorhynchus assimilis]